MQSRLPFEIFYSRAMIFCCLASGFGCSGSGSVPTHNQPDEPHIQESTQQDASPDQNEIRSDQSQIRSDQESTPAKAPEIGDLNESPDRIVCQDDQDCINSCAQGAVALAWYIKAFPGREACEDGCTNRNSGPPQCIEGQCTAFTRDGKRADGCTNIKAKIESPGPVHRCQLASDCMNTCRYGAVNKQFLSYFVQNFADCHGGCLTSANEPPQCVEGVCTAFSSGQAAPSCTQKSTWPAIDMIEFGNPPVPQAILGKTRTQIEGLTSFAPKNDGDWIRYGKTTFVRYEGQKCVKVRKRLESGLSCTVAANQMGFSKAGFPLRRRTSCEWPGMSPRHKLAHGVAGHFDRQTNIFEIWLR